MSNISDLVLLLAIGALVGSWLKLSRVRELAMEEASRQCQRHSLQLLDESVGLRALRLRRTNGHWRLECGYDFEVSIDGDDREPGRLWLRGGRLTGLSLPTIELQMPGKPAPSSSATPTSSNVVPLRPRLRDQDPRH